MHGMLFTTINDNPAQRNLYVQSKRKGAACPHCLEDTCAIWLRHSKKYVFMGRHRFLSKKHQYRAMDCQFNGEKENREVSLHVTGDLVYLKVKDIKIIEELPKLTKKPLAKERNEMVRRRRRRNVEQEINSMGARVLVDVGCASFD
jgi:hypothetical protein